MSEYQKGDRVVHEYGSPGTVVDLDEDGDPCVDHDDDDNESIGEYAKCYTPEPFGVGDWVRQGREQKGIVKTLGGRTSVVDLCIGGYGRCNIDNEILRRVAPPEGVEGDGVPMMTRVPIRIDCKLLKIDGAPRPAHWLKGTDESVKADWCRTCGGDDTHAPCPYLADTRGSLVGQELYLRGRNVYRCSVGSGPKAWQTRCDRGYDWAMRNGKQYDEPMYEPDLADDGYSVTYIAGTAEAIPPTWTIKVV